MKKNEYNGGERKDGRNEETERGEERRHERGVREGRNEETGRGEERRNEEGRRKAKWKGEETRNEQSGEEKTK